MNKQTFSFLLSSMTCLYFVPSMFLSNDFFGKSPIDNLPRDVHSILITSQDQISSRNMNTSKKETNLYSATNASLPLPAKSSCGAKKSRPTITIAAPCLGRDILSGRSDYFLDSIYKQTVLPLELVMVISDTTPEICARQTTSARLRLPLSVGVTVNCTSARINQADARNFASALALGDLVMFSDADDPMHHERVEIISEMFCENDKLKVFSHSYTSTYPEFNISLFPQEERGNYLHPQFPNPINYFNHTLFSPPSFEHLIMRGNSLKDAARKGQSDPGSCVNPRRCWLVAGMLPGASTVHRSIMSQIPFPCNGERSDGGCISEDSLWLRKILKAYPGTNESLYIDLPLLFYIESGYQRSAKVARFKNIAFHKLFRD